MNKPIVLGIAGSLRNGRWGSGKKGLVRDIMAIKNEDELFTYLKVQSELHLDNFVQAGRKEGKDFSEIYSSLKKNPGDVGLSNSEVALAAAMWGAAQQGTELEYVSLLEHFKGADRLCDEDVLKKKIMEADGLLISGPVYFGDRGSLVTKLFNFIKRDPELRESIKGKVYGGLAVGAKRNGGQETTLIYQMSDMLEFGVLGVGNDSDTTSQYGGTCVGGDVGTVHRDEYGLRTSIGTGRRVGRVLNELSYGDRMKAKPRALFLILQESNGIAEKGVNRYLEAFSEELDSTVLNVTELEVNPCIACDICPTHIDVDEEYRCIVRTKRDAFVKIHETLLDYDMIVPVVVSVKEGATIESVYQLFIERTRYLRRGDYVFSDLLTCPLIFEEIGAGGSYAIRLMTSFVRHHTIMFKPTIEYIHNGVALNESESIENFKAAVGLLPKIVTGRFMVESGRTKYNPIGYVLSVDKDKEDEKLAKRRESYNSRVARVRKLSVKKLKG